MITEALIISMIVLFIHSTSWGGMIFDGIKKIVKPESFLHNPIYGCPICMTPWYGTAIYLLFFNEGLRDWFLTIGLACGFSVISVVLLTIRGTALDISDKIEKENEK